MRDLIEAGCAWRGERGLKPRLKRGRAIIGRTQEGARLITLTTPRWKAAGLLIPTLALLGLGIAVGRILWGTTSPLWLMVALVAALGAWGIGFVVVRWRRPALLELHPEGLRLETAFRTYQWRWSDLLSVYRHHGHQGPARAVLAWSPGTGRRSRTTVLPWGWNVPPEALVEALRAGLEASRQGGDVLAAVKAALAAPRTSLSPAAVILMFSPILIGWALMLFVHDPAQNAPSKKMRAIGVEETRRVIAQCGEPYFRRVATWRLREALRTGKCPTGERSSGGYSERRRLRLEAERRAAADAG